MLRFFTSLKLTLGLLLVLAVISIGGTLQPAQPGHYELFYQSLWFRIILALLALNLLCCTLKILPERWRSRERLFAALRARQGRGQLFSTEAGLTETKNSLQAAGFRLQQRDQLLLAEKGRFGRWGVVIVHLAVLLIMLGAVWGETGFVGTLNTYLHQPNQRYFDWHAQQELVLGFGFRADRFQLRYYPIQLRFDLTDASGRRNYGQLMVYDHETFDVPETPFRVQLRGFDPDARLLTMDVFSGEKPLGQYLVGERFEQFGRQRNPGFRLRNIEFRDPVLKQMETAVSVLENGKVVKQGLIRVNQPLTYRGVSFYQIAYDRDQLGNWSVGFQLSKDPGEGLVWVASVLLMLGFAVTFLLHHRALGIKIEAGRLCLYPLKGWHGESGRLQLQELQARLNG